jgi:carbonic anhydrase
MELPARLLEGYRTFLDQRLPLERSRYEHLARAGQRPDVMIISCCDSRVSPDVIFDSRPGEMFVLRNVANLVPPYQQTGPIHDTSAALEFAAQVLEVKSIIIMGHSHCGGVRAFMEHKGCTVPGDFIDSWVGLIAPATNRIRARGEITGAGYLRELERASVVQTLENVMSFPFIRQRVEKLQLQLFGTYFDVATGELSSYDSTEDDFAPIKTVVA